MTDDTLARRRWLTLVGIRIAGSAGAVFGVVLLGRATRWPEQALGIVIVLAALGMIATVPRALARQWRSPPRPGQEK